MITKRWLKKAYQLGKLTLNDSQAVIEACYQIFGKDLGQMSDVAQTPPKQLTIFKFI